MTPHAHTHTQNDADGSAVAVCLVGPQLCAAGEDAYRKIRAGASLVELYTAFAYEGPALIPAIKQELAACLERDGFSSVSEAVGADHNRSLSRSGSSLKRRNSGSCS